MLNWLKAFLMFIGRICLGIIFLWSAIDKILNFTAYIELMIPEGLANPSAYLAGSILVEFIGGLSLVFGFWTRFGALLLLIYMVPATLIFHDFWMVAEHVSRSLQTTLFLKNLAIFGGLLYVLTCGPGLCCYTKCKKEEDSEVSN